MVKKGRLRKPAFALAAFGMASFVLFVTAEVLLRLFTYGPLYVADPVLGSTMRPGVVTRHRRADVDQEIRINSHGFHDEEYPLEKPSGTRRVLVLGDSYMEALQVGIPDSYAKKLQACLTRPERPVQVINSGRSGRGPLEEHLVLSRQGWTFQPDLVVQAFVMNDVTDDARARSLIDVDADGRPVAFRKQGISSVPLWIKAVVHRSWAAYRLLEAASIAWQVMHRGGAATAAGAGVPGGPRDPSGKPMTADMFQIVRTPYSAETEAAWRFTLDVLRRMNADCRARKVPFVIMVIPLETAFDERQTPNKNFWKLEGKGLERPHEILAEFGAKEGIPVIDLLPGFRASPVRPLHALEGHWNKQGNALAAELACKVVEERGLLK